MAILRGFLPSNTLSPGVRIREIDLSFIAPSRSQHRCGMVGFASKGPVNIPTLVQTHRQLWTIFGYPHPQEGDPHLIYAAQQYLLIANELFIVRVADLDQVSDDAAATAEIEVPVAGGVIGVCSEIAGPVAGEYVFDQDVFFRWKLNGILMSKTLVALANDVSNTDNPTGYTAAQLAVVFNDQLATDDGIIFYTSSDLLCVRTTFAFGPDSELEFISVLDALYGGTVVNRNTATNEFPGLGTGMTVAATTSGVDGYTASGTGGPTSGEWDFTGVTDQTIDVVVDGTQNVIIDNVKQTIDLDSLVVSDGPTLTTAEIAAEINAQIADGTLPGGFEAAGGGVTGPSLVSDAAATAETLTLRTLHHGRGARILVKSSSTTNAIFEWTNLTVVGISPLGTADAVGDSALGRMTGAVAGVSPITTFTLKAESPGVEGNLTLVRIANNLRENNWTIEVYNNDANVESWGQLTKDATSRFYIGTYLALVSDYIRATDNTATSSPPLDGDYTLVGGADGIPKDPDAQDSLLCGNLLDFSGVFALSEPEQLDIDYLAVPGHPSTSVVLCMLDVVENYRLDAMAIIDPPFGLTVTEIVHWQAGNHPLNTTKLDSDFGALYWPWLKYRDFHNSIDVWIPPSGSIAAVYARSDQLSAPWFAPAGITRGLVPSILDVFSRPSLAERDAMYGNRNAINPIIQFADGDGFIVWGQKTLQGKPSALDRVNVRRLMFFIEKAIRRESKRLLFEPHDEIFRSRFIEIASAILKDVQTGRGITNYKIQADAELNTPDVIDRNEFRARIGIIPTRAVEFIFIDFSIHRTGSNFTESTVDAF